MFMENKQKVRILYSAKMPKNWKQLYFSNIWGIRMLLRRGLEEVVN